MNSGIDDQTRRRVLAEWRGYWEPRPKPDRCREAGVVANQVIESWGLGERLLESMVTKAWREIVGDFLAAHSQPTNLTKGTLIVRVLQPAVHYELDRHHRQTILAEMKKRFGAQAIRDVKFRLG